MWRTHDGWGWLMLLSGMLWITFVAGVVYVIAWFARGHGPEPMAPSEPLEIARRRYAAGEITRDQFLALCADLTARSDDEGRDAMSGDHTDH